MPDNFLINAGPSSGGQPVRAVEKGAAKHQVVVLDLVAGTAESLVSGALPVTGTFFQATQPVSGTFWQATQPVSIASMPSTPVTGTFWQATQPVSLASTEISNFPATQAVTGTFWQATQPVSGTVTANLGAGTNLVGDVGMQVRANATGAMTGHHIVAAGSTNVAQIKATAGRVYGWCLSNTTASWRYVKLHNVASATAGAAVAQTIGIPPNDKAVCSFPLGIAFATAISRSIVTGSADADATAVTAGDVVGDIFFA